MNKKTAKLLRKSASETGVDYNKLKSAWLATPAPEKKFWRQQLNQTTTKKV